MSLESALAELSDLVAKLNTTLAATNANQERLIAGQAVAIEKLGDAGKAPVTRGRKSKEDPVVAETTVETAANEPAGNASADTASPEADAKTAVEVPTDENGLKEHIRAFTSSTDDQDERASRVALMRAMSAGLGVGPKVAELVPHAAKVVFFIERYKAGITDIDFAAEYDFNGDPAQEVEDF
jgi:hypothetical protein